MLVPEIVSDIGNEAGDSYPNDLKRPAPRRIPRDVEVYEINHPFFFGAPVAAAG